MIAVLARAYAFALRIEAANSVDDVHASQCGVAVCCRRELLCSPTALGAKAVHQHVGRLAFSRAHKQHANKGIEQEWRCHLHRIVLGVLFEIIYYLERFLVVAREQGIFKLKYVVVLADAYVFLN